MHQTQLLFGFMTPREHLTFQAIARMSRKHSTQEINARVEEVRQTDRQGQRDTDHQQQRQEAGASGRQAGLSPGWLACVVCVVTRGPRQVLKEARLEKCADTLIGGTDLLFLRRGVSGGERKRVAIATELLLCPDVIFLDEPT